MLAQNIQQYFLVCNKELSSRIYKHSIHHIICKTMIQLRHRVMRVNKIGRNYEGTEDEIRQRIKHGLSLLKQRMERDVGIEILENVPMNLTRLYETGAGQKLTRVFESSRILPASDFVWERTVMIRSLQEKRPRGRPRKNSTPVQSRGGTPGRGRRGRPPIKR
uniref:40S ribosomal protein S18 n=1 Tax=Heterorhabditis bacteriophora TaxID=37862 RepID=A0A1I7XKS4_HETBA